MLVIGVELVALVSQHFGNGVFELGTLLAVVACSANNLENVVVAIIGIRLKFTCLKVFIHVNQRSLGYFDRTNNMLTMQIDEISQ